MISPQAGAQTALSYAGGAGGAGIQVTGTGGRGNVVMFGFPFETITTAANRAAVMDRVLDFFLSQRRFQRQRHRRRSDYVVWRNNNGTSVPRTTLGDANGDGLVNQTDYTIWRSQFGTSPLVLGAGAGAGESLGAPALSQSTVAPLAAALTAAPVGDAKSVSARELGFSAMGATESKRLSFPKRSAVLASHGFAQTNHDWAALLNIIAEHEPIARLRA